MLVRRRRQAGGGGIRRRGRRDPIELAASRGGCARYGGVRHFLPAAPGLAGQVRYLSARLSGASASKAECVINDGLREEHGIRRESGAGHGSRNGYWSRDRRAARVRCNDGSYLRRES